MTTQDLVFVFFVFALGVTLGLIISAESHPIDEIAYHADPPWWGPSWYDGFYLHREQINETYYRYYDYVQYRPDVPEFYLEVNWET